MLMAAASPRDVHVIGLPVGDRDSKVGRDSIDDLGLAVDEDLIAAPVGSGVGLVLIVDRDSDHFHRKIGARLIVVRPPPHSG